MQLTSPLLKSLIGIIALFILAGCGGEKPAASTETVGADGVRTIQVTGNDAMKFNITEITATAGEPLRLTLTNIGKMPKQGMAHNWVLLKPIAESEINKIGMAAATRGPEYLPEDQSQILVHTRMLGPGESDTIEFNAPTDPGAYPFICTFPGHYAIMRGTLKVTAP